MSVPVRLCDIPTAILDRAVRELIEDETSATARADILAAAVRPSKRVYLLPESKRKLVESWKQAA